MQDNEKAKSDSFEVSWKEITQRRIDTEKLRAEQPKIYNQYLKTYQMRKFGVKDVQEEFYNGSKRSFSN